MSTYQTLGCSVQLLRLGPLNTASAESNPLLMIIIQAEQSVRLSFDHLTDLTFGAKMRCFEKSDGQGVDTFFFCHRLRSHSWHAEKRVGRGPRSGFLLSHLMLKELQHRGAHPLLAILLRYLAIYY